MILSGYHSTHLSKVLISSIQRNLHNHFQRHLHTSLHHLHKMHSNPFTSKYVPGIIPQIKLTDTESEIVNLLNSYTKVYNDKPENADQQIILRITGGWVRDKLLNHPSHDIDIGIDNCSGETFVTHLKEWLENKEKVTGHGTEGEPHGSTINKIHKIKKNPDKSKHLETCTTKICGLDIDFVNLRSESYSDDSRIPTITTGTPIQDAYRRDATLNALFFNLTTMTIEDLTGSGLKDLAHGVLRTPLEPRKTFLDDPLRCLRLIRFASNYGFEIDPVTIEAMKDNDIKVALNTKISRERIGVEFRKMIINKRGLVGVREALGFIREVNFSCIFDLGDTKVDESWLVENEKKLNDDILENIGNILEKLPTILEADVLKYSSYLGDASEENDRILFFTSLILKGWRDTKVKVGKKETYVSYLCILNGLKLPLRTADNVSMVVRNVENTVKAAKEFRDMSRSDLAKHFILPYQDKWELNLLINCCLECFDGFDNYGAVLSKYDQLMQCIYRLELESSFREQVLLNGKDLMKILNKKPGPWLKTITDQLFTWQLDHPACTKEDMMEYLKTIQEV